jgi:GMP synthase-like glutamine amidotransferase
MKALEINKSLKVTGFCFGHQMIAQAFGAKVQKKHVTSGL